MKRLRLPRIVIISILCVVLLCGSHENLFNETLHSARPHLFNATISSNQEEYMIYEEIVATFNFSSHVTNEDYFVFALSENINFNPIHQSEPIQGNFSISRIYTFSLLSLNYSFLEQDIVLYLLLYYMEPSFENIICCSKSITINKADLVCDFPENFTQIKECTKYNVSFRFYDLKNSQFFLEEEEVACWILFDNNIHEIFTLRTSPDGYLHFQIESDKKTKTCKILLICNSSKWFNSAQFSLQLAILQSLPSSNQIITTITVIFSVGIACSCIVYFGIIFYKKKLKRHYTFRDIKI